MMSLPNRRHCRKMPPDDIFFSASISVKPNELAKIRTSTRLIALWRNVIAVSIERPWVGSIFSSSCWNKKINPKQLFMVVWLYLQTEILDCSKRGENQQYTIINCTLWIASNYKEHVQKQMQQSSGFQTKCSFWILLMQLQEASCDQQASRLSKQLHPYMHSRK